MIQLLDHEMVDSWTMCLKKHWIEKTKYHPPVQFDTSELEKLLEPTLGREYRFQT